MTKLAQAADLNKRLVIAKPVPPSITSSDFQTSDKNALTPLSLLTHKNASIRQFIFNFFVA